jgi:hypothetical protein
MVVKTAGESYCPTSARPQRCYVPDRADAVLRTAIGSALTVPVYVPVALLSGIYIPETR